MSNVVSLHDRLPPADRGLQTFALEADRKRLTGTALKAMVRVAEAWDLGNADAAALLAVSVSTWDRIKAAKWDGVLSQDQLTRASAIIGIYKGLSLLFADAMATRWPLLRNRNPLYAGRSAVETMIEGGIPVMLEVRRHVDAMRGGL
ncbi:antitoxin Xre-like helix-turn-helix domain-containing protein [Novosphingobium sp. BL-52-GroH]|uniref:antitoxin Xre-like helix-turn-helix domain-containing protein n=1 Tax=Novosphingobium sp. BL-52-GroH TaxID=3349877 RepID=UPI00384F9716